jgi:hypothetical protein
MGTGTASASASGSVTEAASGYVRLVRCADVAFVIMATLWKLTR